MSRVTLKEVAKQAGVSYQTVSKVVNHSVKVSDETAQRIWEAVKELGYHPNLIARSLRSQRSNMIGYSWEPSSQDQPNPILDQFLQSMAQSAEDCGYHLLAFPHKTGEQWVDSYRTLIETNRVDAFVISSVEYNDPRVFYLQEAEFPFIAFGRSNPDWDFPYVDIDGGAGMRMVVQHLLELGHRKIAALAWPGDSRVGQNRMDGFLGALYEANIYLNSEMIARGEGVYDFGRRATDDFLSWPEEKRPTAIVAFNDMMAIGAMHAIMARGYQVGTDIAVTGFDDLPLMQYYNPPLTSVRQPIWDVGKNIVEILVSILTGEERTEKQILLQPKLIVRRSSTGLPEEYSPNEPNPLNHL